MTSTYGEKDALITEDTLGNRRRMSYEQVQRQVETLAAGLVAHGVQPGDAVAILVTNVIEFIPTVFALWRIGAAAVPMNTWLKDDEIAYLLNKSRSRLLITMDHFRKIDFCAMIGRLWPEWGELPPEEVPRSDRLPHLESVIVIERSGPAPASAIPFSLLEQPVTDGVARQVEEWANSVEPNALALIKFTSGSTSFPKGALLEQWGLVTNGLAHTERLRITHQDRIFNPRPFFHVGGTVWGLMTAFTRGAALIFIESWDVDLAIDLMERERCTVSLAVGPMNVDLISTLQASPRDLPAMRMASSDVSNAEPLREALGLSTVFRAYGLTEAYGPSSVIGPDDTREIQNTKMGRLLPGMECRIIDPDTGEDVPDGEVGEILLRGMVMRGYFELQDQSASAIDAHGWLHPQDLVTRDERGYITFVGRRKAMLKVGGENIAAEEVENVLRAHPEVRDVCVVGARDARKGEVPRAYVAVGEEQAVEPEELREWCRARLATFKVPRDVILVSELPRTGNGKIDRAAVKRWIEPEAVNHITTG